MVGVSRNVVSERFVQRANAAMSSSVDPVGVVHDRDRVAQEGSLEKTSTWLKVRMPAR